MKKLFILLILICFLVPFRAQTKEITKCIDKKAWNKFFSITLPLELKGLYEIKTKKMQFHYFIKNLKKRALAGLLLE
ncbi:hypothetical protein IJ531_04975 [bacterium]|nr:hypothetical protein [bacterium]